MSDDDLIRRGDALQLVEEYETIHDRISLLPAALPARGVGVKPLVWVEQAGKSYRQANCALGQYQISWLVEFECWQLVLPPKQGQPWKDNFSRHSHKDEAKAAAQADYEARILSALATQPAPEPRDVRAAADEIREAITQQALAHMRDGRSEAAAALKDLSIAISPALALIDKEPRT